MDLMSITKEQLPQAAEIWNQVVAAGDAFPGDEILSLEEAWEMFQAQTETVTAVENGEVLGVYILHPNGFGRATHIANASYAVRKDMRGRGIGRCMVLDCIERAKKNGFKGLQFNGVVSTNYSALALYLKLGFTMVGTITNGFRMKDGSYVDSLICLKSW